MNIYMKTFWILFIVGTTTILYHGIYGGVSTLKKREKFYHLTCENDGKVIFDDHIKYGDYYLDSNVLRVYSDVKTNRVYDLCVEREVK